MSDSDVILHAHGMHCHGCEHVIEVGVGKLAASSPACEASKPIIRRKR